MFHCMVTLGDHVYLSKACSRLVPGLQRPGDHSFLEKEVPTKVLTPTESKILPMVLAPD
jgi:hypothetical protein